MISVVSQESSDRPLPDSQFAQISGCLNDFECEQVSRQRPGVVTDLADVPIVVRDRLLPEIEAEGCAGSVSGAVIISKEIASRVSPKPV